MRIHESMKDLIGNTPLIRLNALNTEGSAQVLVKLEAANPYSSVKDRIGLALIESAEALGELRSGSVIIEPTSGNTGRSGRAHV